MKEFMNELGKKVNEVAEQIGRKTEPLMKKTEGVVEVQKLKAQIRNLNKNNDLDLCDLGEIVFMKYQEGTVEDEEFAAICEGIMQRIDAIDELERQVIELKGMAICPECEMKVERTATFCSNCGAKLEFEEPEVVVEEPEFVDEDEVIVEAEIVEAEIVEDEEDDDDEVEVEFVEIEVEPAEKVEE